jgi:hypothetical protein
MASKVRQATKKEVKEFRDSCHEWQFQLLGQGVPWDADKRFAVYEQGFRWRPDPDADKLGSSSDEREGDATAGQPAASGQLEQYVHILHCHCGRPVTPCPAHFAKRLRDNALPALDWQ